MYTVNAPSLIIRESLKEAVEKARFELARFAPGESVPDDLGPEAVALNLSEIEEFSKDDCALIALLTVRNHRKFEENEKLAKAVIDLMKQNDFTVSEALLFLKYVEKFVLTAKV